MRGAVDYLIVDDDPFEEGSQARLQALGREGWQLIQVLQEKLDKTEGDEEYDYVFIMMRPSDGINKYTGSGTHREFVRKSRNTESATDIV